MSHQMSDLQGAILADINEVLGSLPYGQVTFTVTRHNAEGTRLDANVGRSYKVTDNAEAGMLFIQLLKNAAEAGLTGVVSFSISLRDGQATRMVKTKHLDHTYPVNQGKPKQA